MSKMVRNMTLGLAISLSIVGLTGCIGNERKTEDYNSNIIEQEEQQEKIEIDINDFKVDGKIEKSVEENFYKAKLTNNSNYIVKYADYKYEYTNSKGEKENTYLTFTDTLKPGKTSAVTQTLGEKDMKLKKIEITLIDKENNRGIIVEHDVVLEETRLTEMPLELIG